MCEALRASIGKDAAAEGVEPTERPAVIEYLMQRFEKETFTRSTLPLPDAPSTPDWCNYADEVRLRGSLRALLPHLQGEPATHGSTSGAANSSEGMFLDAPEHGTLTMEDTSAGRLPVICCGSRADFVRMVCTLARRNGAQVPDSMGALLINNYWSAACQDRYLAEVISRGRAAVVKAVKREDFRDCFAIVGPGPYSGIPSELVFLDNEEWLQMSLALRKSHECVHYLTRRLYGSMHIHLHDELLADYGAMVSVTGAFRPDWCRLFFFGAGAQSAIPGRAESYMPVRFSAAARACVTRVLRTAVDTLAAFAARFGQRWLPSQGEYTACLCSIASLSLAELAQVDAVAKLHRLYDHQVSRSGEGNP